eukprot:CAMPEP_0114619574 /NCGR_PEP_ID=MMETSP0168-20121206/8282_1 /TAXON_ID=95228 ORGANISM="Vannella sp., Strain DIVA3 517/6/12" /NCGR_SAMPLE_ID=MMETSP0168 /ASSEMBLY_ACC=CAM_ASM_000044 /LENGTH=351 /DNA_ID=CAMNT_0001830743 /DNA_START=34 /DNA_END=1086 /DNA_ORIENTATION=-
MAKHANKAEDDLAKVEKEREHEGRNLGDADSFWHSFSYTGTHESVLKDIEVVKSFRNAFLNNKHLVKDKIVLDVGCGLGVLCMFAAQAGAAHVYGVEKTDIIEKAREIIKENGFADKVTLIQGRMEDVELPVEKVDIIVSEWMGYCLFSGGQFDPVLAARDKWLAEGGIMFPDKAANFICGVYDKDTYDAKVEWWKDAWGHDMSIIGKKSLHEVFMNYNEINYIITDHAKTLGVDLLTCKQEEIDEWDKPFQLTCTTASYIYAFMMYFQVEFTQCHKRINLCTGPLDKPTRHRQSMFYLREPLYLEEGDTIRGRVRCKRNKVNPRDLDFVIVYSMSNKYYQIENVIQKFFL